MARPNGLAVGIDLGTTYSVVAYLDPQGRPTSVVNSSGDLLTPSVVLFEDDGVVVGKEAVAASVLEPHRVAECVKRDMGAKLYRKTVDGRELPPEVISSLILKKLKADAERKLGPITAAVVTVPAYFDEPRRRATADAGRLAGLDVIDIVNEPTAAALAYCYKIGLLDGTSAPRDMRPFRPLVYDLGGGTFDVTVVELRNGSFRAIATDGDVLLGGKDWDERLVALAAEQYVRAKGVDPRGDAESLQELTIAAEVAKRTLSERSKATIVVNHRGDRLKVEVTRKAFEEATEPLLERTRTTAEIVVMQAGLTWSDIDCVLLVGGSTRMPMVSAMLESLTGKTPDSSLSADEAVAHGAALFAGLRLRDSEPETGDEPAEFTVTDVNSHSLGLVGISTETGERANQILIPKNTPLPATTARRFKTLKAGQKSVKIVILEGESELPGACTHVGDAVLRRLPPDLPAGFPVEVRYSYLANGTLSVSAALVGLGASIQTDFLRINEMSEDDITFWVEHLSKRKLK